LAGAGLAEWDEPQAGMFLWLKLNKVKDTKALMEKAINKEVSNPYYNMHQTLCVAPRADIHSRECELLYACFSGAYTQWQCVPY
jgi:hypothetical protein